eukprot:3156903-Rhodomonas_salina.2
MDLERAVLDYVEGVTPLTKLQQRLTLAFELHTQLQRQLRQKVCARDPDSRHGPHSAVLSESERLPETAYSWAHPSKDTPAASERLCCEGCARRGARPDGMQHRRHRVRLSGTDLCRCDGAWESHGAPCCAASAQAASAARTEARPAPRSAPARDRAQGCAASFRVSVRVSTAVKQRFD